MVVQAKAQTAAIDTVQPLPRKFVPLLWYIVKRTIAIFIKQLPSMIIFGILGWLFHTFLMVYVNDGFSSDTIIGGMLATQGNGLGGTVIWTIASGFIFSWLSQARQRKGKARFAMPPFKTYFTKAGDLALASLTAAAGICVVIGATVNNIANVAMAAGLGALLLSQGRAVVSLLIRSAWTTTYGLVQNKKVAQFGTAAGYVAIVGGALGFVLSATIPLAWAKAVIGIALLAGAFYLTRRSAKTITASIFLVAGLIAIVYLLDAAPVLANDGGWKEAGGDFLTWLRSEGAVEAVIRGLGPGLGVMLGPAIVEMLRELTAGIDPDDLDFDDDAGDDGGTDDGSPTPPAAPEKSEPAGPVIIDYFDGRPLQNWKAGANPDKNGNMGKPGDVLYNEGWVDAEQARKQVALDEDYNKRNIADSQRKIADARRRADELMDRKGEEGRKSEEEFAHKQAQEEAQAQAAQKNRERIQKTMIKRLSGDPSLQDRVKQLQAGGNWDEIENLYTDKVGVQIKDGIGESKYWQWWASAHKVGEVGSKLVVAGSKAAMMIVGGPVGAVAIGAGVGVISSAQEGAESYYRGDSTTRVVGSTIVGFLSGVKDGAIGAYVNMPGVGGMTRYFLPAGADMTESYLKSRREAGFAPEGQGESQLQSLQKAGGMGVLSVVTTRLGGTIDGLGSSVAREGAKLAVATVAGGTTSVIQGGTFGEGAQEGLIGGIGAAAGGHIGKPLKEHGETYERDLRAMESSASEEKIKSVIKEVEAERDPAKIVIPLDKQPEIIRQLDASRHSEVAVTTEHVVVRNPDGSPEYVQRQRIPTTLDGEPATRQYVSAHRGVDQLGDPATSQTAKQAPLETRDAIVNTRRDQIYAPADNETISKVAPRLIEQGLLQPGDRLVMDTVPTPENKVYTTQDEANEALYKLPKTGADRDARLVIERMDPVTGKVTKLEVDRRLWADDAQRDFYNHTTKLSGGEEAINSQTQPKYFERLKEELKIKDEPGKPPKHTDQEILQMADERTKHQAWAAAKNQVFTDKYHPEAGRDYTDQRTTVINGRPVQTQVEPNVLRVERGETRLEDPEGMALQFKEKSRPFKDIDPQEGISQMQKGIELHMKMRGGYRAQDYEVPPLKEKVSAAMEVIMKAPRGSDATPEAMQKVADELKDLGYGTHDRPPISDAIDKMAAQNEVLHKFSRPPAGQGPDLSTSDTATIAKTMVSGHPSSAEQSPGTDEPVPEDKPFASPGNGIEHKPVSPMGSPREPHATPETTARPGPETRQVPGDTAGSMGKQAGAGQPIRETPVPAAHQQPRPIVPDHRPEATDPEPPDTVRAGTTRPAGDIEDTGREQVHQAELRQAELRQAELRQAELRQAELRHAELHREGLQQQGTKGEGLQHQGLSSQDLQETRLMREELAKAREELARQREEIARVQEEMRRWKEQNGKQ
jgi:hypothetical protein